MVAACVVRQSHARSAWRCCGHIKHHVAPLSGTKPHSATFVAWLNNQHTIFGGYPYAPIAWQVDWLDGGLQQVLTVTWQ